jgi:hypothetical protein
MNLGVVERHLLRVLERRLEGSVDLHAGPVQEGPATGMRAELFVHAARFADLGGRTAEGAYVARRPMALGGGLSGFTEERPAVLEVEITCVCAEHARAQALAGLVSAASLEGLETLRSVLLSDPSDTARRLRFGDHVASLHACASMRAEYGGVAVAHVLLTLRLDGFLHVQLARRGGLQRTSAYEMPIRLTLVADPSGPDVQAEHVLIHNDGEVGVDLGGWSVSDMAPRRPHRYTFASPRLIGPRATLRLWSGRGSDDSENVYWRRRKAVWSNAGDVAVLLDPEGVERARAEHETRGRPRGSRDPD